MESNIKFKLLHNDFNKKENYEPVLLECINCTPFFIKKGGGRFTAPQSEANRENDANGKSGYNIDFKLLISEEGVKRRDAKSFRIVKPKSCSGVIMLKQPSASQSNDKPLPYPLIWGFLLSNSLYLNEKCSIALKDKEDENNVKRTVESLNKIICTKKNIILFYNVMFVIHDNALDTLRERAIKALLIITEARTELSSEYETYYALLFDNSIVLFSNTFEVIACVELTSLKSWNDLCGVWSDLLIKPVSFM